MAELADATEGPEGVMAPYLVRCSRVVSQPSGINLKKPTNKKSVTNTATDLAPPECP